jgi:serine/threonine protein kinase
MNEETADSPQEHDRLQEILLRYVEAAEAGSAPDRQTFLAAHPEFAAEISQFLAGYHQLNRMAAPLRESEAPRAGSGAIRSALRAHARGPQESTEAPDASARVAATAELGQLGDYRLLREIGRGGMGVVYEAEQISLRRRVALKILPFAGGVDARQLQRFRNEAEAAAHLHHSHIVPVFAVGSERGVHFYAMQYIEGQSLASLIADLSAASGPLTPNPSPPEGRGEKQGRPLTRNPSPPEGRGEKGMKSTQAALALSTQHSARSLQFFRRVATIGKQTAEALEYAHQMGVIHRDIKPANLLFDGRGEVWITDFGLAQFQSQAGLTVSGELVGTLRYVSPEQAMAKRGVVDHRTDIYSLGATLYEFLTLQPVFDGKDRHALLRQIDHEEPRLPRLLDPSIPYELETIVLKALAKNAADRYGSAQELADDLERFLEDKPIQAKRPSLAERARKWLRRHPSVVVTAVLLLVFGLIGFAVSTVVIAQAQSRTKTAYDNLKLQEKQLQAAYEKVAIEEKRAKDALADLAEEQARTKAAYDAEETQRRFAEWDFGQARRAIELVVEFSEGELAQKPDQQDVRRRLLLTVLDYYEDFLTQHADDPGVQAGRKHVARLVTELSSLGGTALMTIIRESSVQNDLKLSDEQRKRVIAFVNSHAKPPNPKDKGPRPMESAAAVERALADILEPGQQTRFQEIVLQVQNQGRFGFSDPKLVETLMLTASQREQIRRIQNQTHQAWADHLFTTKKIKKPAEFWADAQARILTVFDAGQRRKWRDMSGTPITVDFREGYPFDGKNVDLPPRPNRPFDFHETWRGAIAVMQSGDDHAGSGFGHKVFVDDKQYYSWRGKEIPPITFEIAVTADPLTHEERKQLLTKGDRPPPESKERNGWLVLFRSADPSVWNTDSPNPAKFAIPVAHAPRDIRYLRLTRMDTGEMQIIAVRHGDLAAAPRLTPDQDFVWNGAASEMWGGRHLGIAETRSLRGAPPKGPDKKGPPGKGKPPGQP